MAETETIPFEPTHRIKEDLVQKYLDPDRPTLRNLYRTADGRIVCANAYNGRAIPLETVGEELASVLPRATEEPQGAAGGRQGRVSKFSLTREALAVVLQAAVSPGGHGECWNNSADRCDNIEAEPGVIVVCVHTRLGTGREESRYLKVRPVMSLETLEV